MFCQHRFRAEATPPQPKEEPQETPQNLSKVMMLLQRPSPDTHPHPKCPHPLWRQSTTDPRGDGRSTCHSPAQAAALGGPWPMPPYAPWKQGSTIPFQSSRVRRREHPSSRGQVHKHPGIPPLNQGPLSPDTKCSV